MAVRTIKKSWWVDFRFHHTRYRQRSPENSRAGALAYEAVLRQKLARGEQITSGVPDAQREQVFEQFVWEWFEQYVATNNKFSEQCTKRYVIRAHLVPFFGQARIDRITSFQIQQYAARLVAKGLSRKTVNNHLTILHACLTAAYDWLALGGAPPKITWLKCPPPRTDYLSADECELLLAHSQGTLREMIFTTLRTGMRLGEIKGLQWSSIDWQTRTLSIRHSWCVYGKTLTSPKSNRERHIPLDTDVLAILYRRKKETGFVFMGSCGKPYGGTHLGRELAKTCEKAGLRKIGWHTLRHTFASLLVMRGAPLPAVQALLGHSTIVTTMRYTHLAPSTLRTAIEMLNPEHMASGDFGQPVGNPWVDGQRSEIVRKMQTLENTGFAR